MKNWNKNYWNKPVNIELKNLQPYVAKNDPGILNFPLSTYYTTVKINGKRNFLLVIKNIVWCINPQTEYTIFFLTNVQRNKDKL